jgi:hypothetical protein
VVLGSLKPDVVLRLGAERRLDVLREEDVPKLRRLDELREDEEDGLRLRLDDGVENDLRLDEGVGNDRVLVVGAERRVVTDGRRVEIDGRDELRIEELPRLIRDDELRVLRELREGADERAGADRREELRMERLDEPLDERAGEERLLGGAAESPIEASSSIAAASMTANTVKRGVRCRSRAKVMSVPPVLLLSAESRPADSRCADCAETAWKATSSCIAPPKPLSGRGLRRLHRARSEVSAIAEAPKCVADSTTPECIG